MFTGAVVGTMANRARSISCGVFVPDCSNLQVLQSSDLPLPGHRYVFCNIPSVSRSVCGKLPIVHLCHMKQKESTFLIESWLID